MGYQQYTEEFKKSAVQKFLSRGHRPIRLITEETGVSARSLYLWAEDYGIVPGMKKSERRPQDWTAAEKLEAVIQFAGLPPEKQGEFLRSSGLHLEHIEGWKKTMEAGLGGDLKDSRSSRQELQVVPSFSRPSVSDDNPFSESLFKTLKYRPSFPDGAFASLAEAVEWVSRFVAWYNNEHLHSGIRFVTPMSRHKGKDEVILNNRSVVYETAKQANPTRWSGQTRNWSRIREVRLNPGKEKNVEDQMLRNQAA